MSSLSSWLSDVVQKHKGIGLVLQLRHCKLDQPAALVDKIPYESGEDVEGIAEELEKKAQDDAEVMQTAQVYAVLVLVDNEQVGMRRFRVAPPLGSSHDLGLSEPATQTGLMAQMMRHNEASSSMLARFVGGSGNALLKENERLSQRCATLEESLERLRKLDEKRAGKRWKRERRAKLDQAKLKGLTDLVKSAKMLAPVALGAMLGEAKTKSKNLDNLSVAALLESLDDEQKQTIMSTLRPEQIAAFAGLVEKYGDSFAAQNGDDDDEEEENGDDV